MKTKAITIMLILFLASIGMIALYAAPVAASPEFVLKSEGNGVADWTTEEAHSGDYSVNMSLPTPRVAADGAVVMIPYGKVIGTVDATEGIVEGQQVVINQGFWYKNPASALYPYMVFDIDYDGDGVVDHWLVNAFSWPKPSPPTEWVRAYPTNADPNTGMGGWKMYPSIEGLSTGYEDLSYWKTNLAGKSVVNIKVDYGFSSGTEADLVVYVDDVIINGVTYNLEKPKPIAEEPITLLEDLKTEIGELSGVDFKNPRAAKGQEKALLNKVGAVIRQVKAGAYEGAINKLENDIKDKIEKWVKPDPAEPLITMVDDIIFMLESL